ncbi:RNase adapter protein RapZ [Arthrobacter sp. SO5]|uniref:shikimate kinase n=1 Tax=Arthrobacter sp. SO5 TaxID=1897055 RepID=UPI001E543F1B|nr:AAA family ATPase [Arthrobacter sp. SO5]MCB5273510.1 RNase adapter protein RapZ [Arthrobacter sp. SO5]
MSTTARGLALARMGVVLVTGMSGAGKSTALKELARLGYATVDTDYGSWCNDVDGDTVWNEEKMSALLTAPNLASLFVSGTVSNQGRFYHRFDAVVLLSAPPEVLFRRIETRSTNGYGKLAAEREEIRRHLESVEPLLRKSSTHEIDTTCPVQDVAAQLAQIADESNRQ